MDFPIHINTISMGLPTGFFGPFWWPILGYFPNGKKYVFFPIWWRKFQFKKQKHSPIFWHLNCTVPQQIAFLNSKCWNVLISEPNIWFFVLFDYIIQCEFFPGGSGHVPKMGRKNPDPFCTLRVTGRSFWIMMYISVPEGCINHSKQCRTRWNAAWSCCISSGSSLFAKVPV